MAVAKTSPTFPYHVIAYAQMFNLGHVHRQIVRDNDGDCFWRLIPRDGAAGAWCAGDPRHTAAEHNASPGAHP